LSGKLQDANRRPAGAANTRANTSGSDRFGLVLFAFCHRIVPLAVPLKLILTPFPHAGARNGLKLPAPIHPGEILRENVFLPLNMSVDQLAKPLAVDAARLNEIVRGRRGISAGTALRLARQTKLKDIEHAVRPRSEAA
jgi:addiction module HigA family antidote